MKTVHQRVWPNTQSEAALLLAEINVRRAKLGHKTMTMPEFFNFLVEFYKENSDDNNNR